MYLAFLDEADHTKKKNFTTCGLTAIKAERASSLVKEVEAIRSQYNFSSKDLLKFSANSLPDGITLEDHKSIKKSVIELAQSHEVIFMGYAYFNPASFKFDADRNRVYGFNTLIGKFDKFLRLNKSVGTVTIDRLDISRNSVLSYTNGFEYIKEKFQVGNKFAGHFKEIENVISFSMSCEGTSHLSSVNDILTGSFRYLVNEENDSARRALQHQLEKLMWKNNAGSFVDHGFTLRPTPKSRDKLHESIAAEYGVLRAFLNSRETSA
jgi:hypothetical protein